MKSMKILSLMLFALALLASCGKGTKETQQVIAYNESEKQQIIQSQRLDCAEGTCPEAVGRILSFQDKIYACTGFYLGNGLVLTNQHCLHKCENMYFFFKSYGTTRSYSCMEVVRKGRISKDESKNEDYAIIRLKQKPSITPIALNNSIGLSHNQVYQVWSIDSSHADSGTIVKRDCMAQHNPFPEVRVYFQTNFSRLVVFPDCDVIDGNSGSPVLNQRGEAVALIWAKFNKNSKDGAMALNMSCINAPESGINTARCSAQ
jgi:V8-like Glu-specific endopeptidase